MPWQTFDEVYGGIEAVDYGILNTGDCGDDAVQYIGKRAAYKIGYTAENVAEKIVYRLQYRNHRIVCGVDCVRYCTGDGIPYSGHKRHNSIPYSLEETADCSPYSFPYK